VDVIVQFCEFRFDEPKAPDQQPEHEIESEGVSHDQSAVQIGVEEEKTDQVRETVWDEEMVQEKDHNGNSHLEECEVEVNSLESSKKDELKSQL
jgi:hypothetical protein